jgi:tetratricopeptide (TPR) repeat protein
MEATPLAEAPYVELVMALTMAGRSDRARAVLAQWEARRRTSQTVADTVFKEQMRGFLALAANRYNDAVVAFRAADMMVCQICNAPSQARAYDLGGNPDSALAIYNRYLDTKSAERDIADGIYLPGVHKRLGELYEAKGDRAQALRHYRAFIELWKDADPQLQPKVTDARQRVAALTKGTDSGRRVAPQ